MPHKKKSRRYLAPLVLFTLAGWALWAIGRNDDRGGGDRTESRPRLRRPRARPRSAHARTRPGASAGSPPASRSPRFFGGAAFSAGAGDVVADAIEGETTTEVTAEEAPVEEPAAA